MAIFHSDILHRKSVLRLDSGFSLIELMVVFLVVSIISGLGFASYKSYSDKQILTSAAQDLKQVIDNTKFNALSSVKPSNCASTDSLTGYKFNLMQISNSYTMSALCGANEYVIQNKKPQFPVLILSSSTCTAIQFSSLNGRTSTANCTIGISAYGKTATLTVDPIGNVGIVIN